MTQYFFFDKTVSFADLKDKFKEIKISKLKQVHGATVIELTEDNYNQEYEADACITRASGFALTVHTADCIPLLAHEGEVIGACHGGWRGIKSGVIDNWISKMVGNGARLKHIKVAMGPAIGSCHFEVGEDVAKELSEINGTLLPNSILKEVCLSHPSPKKKFIDLKRLAVFHLEAAGILKENISIESPCTFCEPEKYFSFRRDGAKGVRLESIIYRSK